MGFSVVSNLQDYEGEREFDDLAKFAKENLGPRCPVPANRKSLPTLGIRKSVCN